MKNENVNPKLMRNSEYELMRVFRRDYKTGMEI